MANKRISQLPNGTIIPETIFPIVTSGVTSQTNFSKIRDALSGYTNVWETGTGLNSLVTKNGNNIANGEYSLAQGIDVITNGFASFVHGTGSTVNGNYSIVLGRNITGNTSDTTYVDHLNIKTVPSGTSINNLGIDSSGNVVIVDSFYDIYVTGGTYNSNSGIATFMNNINSTFNVTGFLTGTTDTYVSAVTYNNNVISLKRTESQSDLDLLINTMTGLTVNGIFSATTYQGLPTDIRITGGTYSAGTAVFTNNTGGTFNITGLTTNLPYFGSIVPTSQSTGITGTAFWTATQAGTYTNFGSVVVSGNSFATISRTSGGTFSISQTPLVLDGYALSNEINFPTWSGGTTTYVSGKKVSFLGEYWKAISGTTSADTPSVSSTWVEDNNYGAKNSVNLFNKNTITSGFYINSSGGLVVDATYGTSDFIEVKPSTTYNSNVQIRFRCFFDVNKNPIGVDYSNTFVTAFTTSSTARYIRASLLLTNLNTLDLRDGVSDGTLSPVPYEKTIPYNELNIDSILVNPKVNLFNNTENLASGYYSTTNGTKGTDTLNYKGVNLTRFSGSNFYAAISTNIGGNSLPLFVTGEKYFISYYILNLSGTEKFIWMKSLINGGTPGHGPKLIDGKVRRVWSMVQAASPTTLYYLADPTIDYSAQTASGSITWFTSGSNFLSPDTQALDIRIGGFQVEKVDSNTYVNGVAMIGDSTIQGAAGSNDSLASREVSTFAAGLLNVPFFNRAVGGERTDTMDARWGTDITPLAKNCKYVIIQGGINDIGQDRALSGIQSSITSMYNKAIADGMIPILMTCTPASSIASIPARETDRLALNLWMKTTYPLVMDIATLIADPITPSALNPIWSGDGVHYSITAKRAIGNAIANWEFWDLKTPKPYQQVLSNFTSTKELPFVRKIGDIKLVQGIDIFSNDNNNSLSSRYPLK